MEQALTIVILTKNEEQHIVDVVRNAKTCTPYVLVVDSGSTDATVSLAEREGARVVYRAWDNDFAAQRNFALTQVTTSHVLYLDADERLQDELIAHIQAIVATGDDTRAYSLKRKSVAFGKVFNHGVLRPDWVPRLFPVQAVTWVGKVHEHPEISLPIERLMGYALHYTYTDWTQYMTKFNQYTSIWAQNAYERGKRTSIGGAFFHAWAGFVSMTFLRKGILDGAWGLILGTNHFFYVLMKYLRLYELQQVKQK